MRSCLPYKKKYDQRQDGEKGNSGKAGRKTSQYTLVWLVNRVHIANEVGEIGLERWDSIRLEVPFALYIMGN